MNESQQEELRKRIQEELDECRQSIERLAISAAPVAPDKALGRLTRMDSLNDKGVSEAALNAARRRCYELEQAMERIEKPGFGDCIICGRAIPVERLAALPESTRCVPCASR